MENYASNSNKPKETNQITDKKVVAKANGKLKKKSEAGKLANIFLAGDVASVKSYIIEDVLIPTLKNAVSEVVRNGIDILLYGEVKNRGNKTNASKVSYNNCYNSNSSRSNYGGSSNNYSYDDIIFPSRGDAEVVLDGLNDIIQQYGFASIADLYELANITAGKYTDNNYGWCEILTVSPARVPEGYILRLPRVVPFTK